MDENGTARVWASLISGKPLEGLSLPTTKGRIDVRGLIAPDPSVVRGFMTSIGQVTELGDLIVLRGVHWKGVDFTGARLGSLRFHESRIDDCVFDSCHCEDWRLWGTTIFGSAFRSADLRRSGLGGVEKGQRNSFREIDFTKADLRGTAFKSAEFVRCTFSNTRLDKVDFQSSSFTECVFEGELNEVLFYRKGYRGAHDPEFPPNDMRGVDFRCAKLHLVEFRGLDLDEVRLPEDEEHLLITDYRNALDRVLDTLKTRSDLHSRRLAALLGSCRKWAGPNQKQGVLNKRDLIEAGGEGAVAEFLRLSHM
jgi:uncharacterized protein YjbI with pentapeptide repeats